jgi:hypothetical protein
VDAETRHHRGLRRRYGLTALRGDGVRYHGEKLGEQRGDLSGRQACGQPLVAMQIGEQERGTTGETHRLMAAGNQRLTALRCDVWGGHGTLSGTLVYFLQPSRLAFRAL